VVVLPAPTIAELLVAAWLATFNSGLKDGRLVGDNLAAVLTFGNPLTGGHHRIRSITPSEYLGPTTTSWRCEQGAAG
jgi:hypothetical protein